MTSQVLYQCYLYIYMYIYAYKSFYLYQDSEQTTKPKKPKKLQL